MSKPFGYSHGVDVRGSRIVDASGQVAVDATFEHVVKLTFFLTDISQLAVVRPIRDQFVDPLHPSASSAAEIRRMFRDVLLIEGEVIAVLP